MMAMNLQTSFLTPPFGFALFYLRGVAPESVRTSQIYRGIIPFVSIQVGALGLLAAYPRIATWLPDVVYGAPTAGVGAPRSGDGLDELDRPTQPGDDAAQDEIDKLFEDEDKSDSETQDEIDKLFEDEDKSEEQTQKEIDDLFKDDED